MTEIGFDLQATERFTKTVPTLPIVDRDRYQWLAQNPDGKSPAELNQLVPEITEIELDNTISQAIPGDTLHVAAWNLERGRYWREAVQLIQEHPLLKQVDIFCLSEMDNGMVRAHNEHTTHELALALGMNYVYGVEFLQLSIGTPEEQKLYSGENQQGHHGNAILSRLPLQAVRMLRFPGIEKWYGSLEHRLGGRNAILAEVQIGPQTVTLVSTHLESGRNDNPKRSEEGQLILQELSVHNGDRPVIIGGDMNAGPSAPVIENFRRAGFTVENTNDLNMSTYQEVIDGQIRPGLYHIDYVLSKGLNSVRSPTTPAVVMAAYPCEPTGKMLSDHAIVTAAFQV
ncbi:MAG: endonuclease/exonuclease/phosphatase family protein [Cyanobacteria bacterium P01_F01_bin.86]